MTASNHQPIPSKLRYTTNLTYLSQALPFPNKATTMSPTTKRPSFLSRLSSSSYYTSTSSSTTSSVPAVFRSHSGYNRYAKDSRGHDFSLSYPYTPTTSPSSASTSSTSSSSSQQVSMRYAKDGKGHDFSSTYPEISARLDALEAEVLLNKEGMGEEQRMRYAWHAGRQGS
jgi:hypothetical protein